MFRSSRLSAAVRTRDPTGYDESPQAMAWDRGRRAYSLSHSKAVLLPNDSPAAATHVRSPARETTRTEGAVGAWASRNRCNSGNNLLPIEACGDGSWKLE